MLQADKGLKCPYCRQYIEGYNDVGTTGCVTAVFPVPPATAHLQSLDLTPVLSLLRDSQAKQALIVANNAAKAAALARNPAPKQIRV